MNVKPEKMLIKKYKTPFLVLSIIFLGSIILFFYFKGNKSCTLESYNPETNLTTVSEYFIRDSDTIFHGKFTQYNQKGNKIAEGNFVENEPYGKSIFYYDNGNIESILYKLNSKITQEGIWNYPTGEIERYVLYDDFGIPDFLIRYDEQGNVKSYEGLPLVEIYQYKISNKEKFKLNVDQYLKVGDTLTYKYLLANIPKADRTFKIEMVDFEDNKKNRKINEIPPAIIEVKEKLITKGFVQIKALVEYKFHDTRKTIIRDSTYFKVNVH